MKKLISTLVLLTFVMLSSACSRLTAIEQKPPSMLASKRLLASGYSDRIKHLSLSRQQKKFAAEQSAKLNAYRSLARQLYREHLNGVLTVADQVMKSEAFRIYLDLFLRQAQVVDSKNLSGQQKVMLALDLTPRFYQCFSSTQNRVAQCLREENKIPFTRLGYQQARQSNVNLSCAYSECASQLSVSGFSNEKNRLDNVLLNAGLYDTEWTVNMSIKTMLYYLLLSDRVFN